MDLSIIVPCYNVEQYLNKCLDSITNVPEISYEIVLVNDGSTDDTEKILAEFSCRYGRLIKIINQKNGGLSAARNAGMKSAIGEYIVFIDSDDYINSRELSIIVKAAKRDKVELGYYNYAKIVSGHLKYDKSSILRSCKMKNMSEAIAGVIYAEEVFDRRTNFINSEACFCIYNREFLMNNGFEFQKGIYHEDTLFFYQVITKANRVKYYDNMVYYYVIHEGSITTSNKIAQKREQDKLFIASKILEMKQKNEYNYFFIDSIIVNYFFYTVCRKKIHNNYDFTHIFDCKKLTLKSKLMLLLIKIHSLLGGLNE